MELQQRLVDLRKAKQLSQEELAEKLYVSRQTISNWERGKTYPDLNSLLLLATVFDVSLDNLIKIEHTYDTAKKDKEFLEARASSSSFLFFIVSLNGFVS